MPEGSTLLKLNATNLKDVLWDTLQKVKSGEMLPQAGDVVATQAREILRCVRTQLTIFSQAAQSVSNELIEFAAPNVKK